MKDRVGRKSQAERGEEERVKEKGRGGGERETERRGKRMGREIWPGSLFLNYGKHSNQDSRRQT